MSQRLTFQGGTHVEENKNTRRTQIQKMPAPAVISVPMSQHIGMPCSPLVKVGDVVDFCQKIGDVPKEALGCPVHSGVSGRVKAIEEKYNATGAKVKIVVIENDGEYRLSPEVTPFAKRLADTSTEEIVSVVREAGIAGMGGAGFPSYAKITSALGKVNILIINCAECEPYITANHRLLLEHPERIINGTKILLKALGLRRALIAVEDNKLDAVNKLEDLLADSELIKVKVMKTKYPQGDERQLIYALTGKELPAGKLPADVGCVIFNAETAASIFMAFAKGMPLVERTVTVDGDCVKTPGNLCVTIGTSFRDAIEYCGGLKKEPHKIISGGPMMGMAAWDIDSPVIKGTSAILVFSESVGMKYDKPSQCIRCGRCVSVCPMHLMPLYLASFSKAGDYDKCAEFDVMSCVECGSCAYNCPGNVPIVQHIRAAKGVVGDRLRAEKAAKLKAEAERMEREASLKAEAERIEREAELKAEQKTEKVEPIEQAEPIESTEQPVAAEAAPVEHTEVADTEEAQPLEQAPEAEATADTETEAEAESEDKPDDAQRKAVEEAIRRVKEESKRKAQEAAAKKTVAPPKYNNDDDPVEEENNVEATHDDGEKKHSLFGGLFGRSGKSGKSNKSKPDKHKSEPDDETRRRIEEKKAAAIARQIAESENSESGDADKGDKG